MLYPIVRVILKIVAFFLAPTKVIGLDNIKNQKGGYLISCNHQTYIDVVLMIAKLPTTMYFMAKEELLNKNWFLHWFFSHVNVFPVKRGTADLKAIKSAVELLKNEKVLCIFPQGTRMKQSPFVDRTKMYGGLAMIAMRAKVNVLPMMFTHPPKLLHRNTLIIGPALELSPFFDQKISTETVKEISDQLADRMNTLLREYFDQKAVVKV